MTVEGETFPLPDALPRAGHRQPDRVRGHLPAARGPARPVPAAGRASATRRAERGVRRAGAPAGAPPGGDRARRRSPTPRACWRCRRRSRPCRSTRASGATASSWRRRPASTPTCSPAPRRAARSAWCWPPGRFALLRGRDYVIPEDVKAVARPVLAHRITVQPGAVDDRGQRAPGGRRRARARCRPRPPSRAAGHERAMSPWRPTAALGRALAAGGVGVALAVLARRARRWSC